jgi:hypothetical protein
MINDNKFDPDSSRLHRQKMARMVLNSSDPYTANPQRNHSGEAEEGNFDLGELDEGSNSGADNFEEFETAALRDSPSKSFVDKRVLESSDESSNSSQDSESSSDDSVDEAAAKDDEKAQAELSPSCLDRPNPFTDSFGVPLPIMQHIHSGTLHSRRDATRLHCNRIVSRSYAVVTKLKLQWPVCAQCRAKVPIVHSLLPISKAPPPSRV